MPVVRLVQAVKNKQALPPPQARTASGFSVLALALCDLIQRLKEEETENLCERFPTVGFNLRDRLR